jgi:hypothetical protein
MIKKTCNPSVTHNPPIEGRQLELFNHTGIRHKPQILSIPGVSQKQRDRYRVVFGGEILDDRLSIDQAIALAKGGER